MELPDIKSRLSLSRVLNHYGLKADKQNRLKCPFHADKTPSMQLYYKTQSCYCFSTNCKTHGKSIDVIDFIMYYENLSKHQAIEKARSLIGDSPDQLAVPAKSLPGTTHQDTCESRSRFLEHIFIYFKNAVSNSIPAREYIRSRGLNYQFTEIGYNSGQFHHGSRKDEKLIRDSLQYGLLVDLDRKSRFGEACYQSFGKGCISFGLRDKENMIVGLYFRSLSDHKNSRHYYLRDRRGLYPGYPEIFTQKLILTESIIDAATLLEQEEIRHNYSVLALYGTNGLTQEHKTAISELTKLSEIIFALDTDAAGQAARLKYAGYFKEHYPNIALSLLDLPYKDINETHLAHSGEIFTHLLANRIPLDTEFIEATLLVSDEKEAVSIPDTNNNTIVITSIEEKTTPVSDSVEPLATATDVSETVSGGVVNRLDTSQPYNLKYSCHGVLYQIKGFKIDQIDSLKVTLQITLL